jgi:hypothetical protein
MNVKLFEILSEFKNLENLKVCYSRSIKSCGPIESFELMINLKYLGIYVKGLKNYRFEKFSEHKIPIVGSFRCEHLIIADNYLYKSYETRPCFSL